jgi:hypothetical protein
MIEKQEFYHGAAVLRIINDPRTSSLRPHLGGYLVNEGIFALVKFSTKATTPWRFTFTRAEIATITSEANARFVTIAFVCGGDGICAVRWPELESLIDDRLWISCSRPFKKRYSVSGPLGDLAGRVPHHRWPGALFAE